MEYYIRNISCDADFLSHHGILGMKWGIRRFQNRDGSLTDEGKRHRGVLDKADAPRHSASKARKQAKERARNLEKARAARVAKAEYERGKEEALKRGSATDIAKYKGDLTTQQMNDAINRLNAEARLAELVAKEQPKVKTGKDHVNDILSFMDMVNKVSSKLIEYSQTADKVKKLFGEDSEAKEKARAKKVKEIIARGDPEEILNNINLMTASESENANKRINQINNIKKYLPPNSPLINS